MTSSARCRGVRAADAAGRRTDHGRGGEACAGLRPQFVPEPRKAPLAGNTIGTDRAFLAETCPPSSAHALPQCRRVEHQGTRPALVPAGYYQAPAKSGNHRALADVQESIEELRYYREAVFVPRPAPTGDRRKMAAGTRAR